MKKAWIENGQVRDVAHDEPTLIFTPEVAAFYDTDVPDDIRPGATLVDGVWTNTPDPIPKRVWTVIDVRAGLTLSERVKWDNDKTDTIKTAKVEFSSPRNQADTTEVLQLLVDASDISAASMQKILA